MHVRRQLVSLSALGLFTVLAFGSEAPEETSTDTAAAPAAEPAVVDVPAPAAVPAAPAGGACQPWSGSGTPAASIEALFDKATVESAGRKLDLNVDCDDVDDWDDQRTMDCELWNQRWDFDVSVSKYRAARLAREAAEDPWVGQAVRQDGVWLISVEAENGACAEDLMKAVLPVKVSTKGYDEARIVTAMRGAGWQIGDGGCSMEKYDGTMSFSCPGERKPDLEASVSVSYEIDGGSKIEEERSLEQGHVYVYQAYGDASCRVDDSASARAMLAALLK